MQKSTYLNVTALENELWQTALESVGMVEIDRACALSLRRWIAIGVQRMERQRRLESEDVALAHANLVKLELMKGEAVFLGRPAHLDNTTFHAARRKLRAIGSLDDVHSLAVLAA